jgi:adenylate cyclase
MPESEPDNEWRRDLGAAVTAIDALDTASVAGLDDDSTYDFNAMRSCAAQIAPLLGAADADVHELRNLAGAMRGYAEMLRESLPPVEGSIQRALRIVLDGGKRPAVSASVAAAPGTRAHATSDPGFILAVDDREENRELLARYLTRSGHFVVTAPGGARRWRPSTMPTSTWCCSIAACPAWTAARCWRASRPMRAGAPRR